MIDFHQHSVFSDGTDPVEELLELNRRRGITCFALTDHDTIAGCRRLLDAARPAERGTEISFVTGIEFSTEDEGNVVHILAYDFDLADEAVGALVARGLLLRRHRCERLLDHLRAHFGIIFDEPTLAGIAASPNPSKPMLANILIGMGYGKTVGEVIGKYLDVHFPDLKLTSREVITQLKEADCLTVWAHPLGEKREFPRESVEKRLEKFCALGLDGLECWYSQYPARECSALEELARARGLLVSCGSDYHGRNKIVPLGQVCCDGIVPCRDISLLSRCKRLYRL